MKKKGNHGDGHLLPDDIIVEILIHVPVKTLIICSSVSRGWRHLIYGPQFSKTHFKLASEQKTLGQTLLLSTGLVTQSFEVLETNLLSRVKNLTFPFKQKDQEAIQLIGPCNGLVCAGQWSFSNKIYRSFSIWNPSTGFFSNLPEHPVRGSEGARNKGTTYEQYGFGYVSSIDGYKVVIIRFVDAIASTVSSDKLSRKAAIFSVRNNFWKTIEAPPHLQYLRQNSGALLNETLHWVDMNLNDTTTITAFDLAKEEFR
ncbi:F-box/kelch-repeat protein At3g23880-like [Rosa rugosa]|uniref:F-box/kelch-repeat protein At3g23880-like n=1 Tax=Rosa rugosa TaxID=74645 RepID=UPI002B40CE94|nr:F-box/kelch-repeat protein At3g23880-like [Rosa rugosa]